MNTKEKGLLPHFNKSVHSPKNRKAFLLHKKGAASSPRDPKTWLERLNPKIGAKNHPFGDTEKTVIQQHHGEQHPGDGQIAGVGVSPRLL